MRNISTVRLLKLNFSSMHVEDDKKPGGPFVKEDSLSEDSESRDQEAEELAIKYLICIPDPNGALLYDMMANRSASWRQKNLRQSILPPGWKVGIGREGRIPIPDGLLPWSDNPYSADMVLAPAVRPPIIPIQPHNRGPLPMMPRPWGGPSGPGPIHPRYPGTDPNIDPRLSSANMGLSPSLAGLYHAAVNTPADDDDVDLEEMEAELPITAMEERDMRRGKHVREHKDAGRNAAPLMAPREEILRQEMFIREQLAREEGIRMAQEGLGGSPIRRPHLHPHLHRPIRRVPHPTVEDEDEVEAELAHAQRAREAERERHRALAQERDREAAENEMLAEDNIALQAALADAEYELENVRLGLIEPRRPGHHPLGIPGHPPYPHGHRHEFIRLPADANPHLRRPHLLPHEREEVVAHDLPYLERLPMPHDHDHERHRSRRARRVHFAEPLEEDVDEFGIGNPFRPRRRRPYHYHFDDLGAHAREELLFSSDEERPLLLPPPRRGPRGRPYWEDDYGL